MKKQSFIMGAVILMIANAVSKILGAVFKIPITYILNEEGMAVFNTAFEVYVMFLAVIISGVPFAISKVIAEYDSKQEYSKIRKTVRVSTVFLAIIGIVGSLVLYFGASFFALAMKEEKAVYAIKMISPSIFFVALGTAYKSYYQGVSNMIPTAISQVVEAIVKVVAGFYLAILFIDLGVEKTSGGAIAGVTAGEIIATVILILMYIPEHKCGIKGKNDIYSKEILVSIITVALPLLCASVVANAINVADTTLIRSRLLDAGFSPEDARYLYGAYTGYALTVFHLPVGILATLGVSILPVIAGAVAVKNHERVKTATDMAIRLVFILSIPCGIIMFTMSSEILNILFHNSSSARMLSTVAPCVIMMCISQITAAILQSSGKIMLPFFISLVGSGIKLSLSYYLIAIPEVNIYGSAISSNAAYIVIMILNLIAVKHYLGLKGNILVTIIKLIIAAAVMYTVIYFLQGPLSSINRIIYLVVLCIVSLGAYTSVLFILDVVSFKELNNLLVKNNKG